jgi:ubiquinone biosynthesis protein
VRDAVLGAVRDLPRLREISAVFVRHGLGDLVRRLGVASVLERAGAVLQGGAGARSTQLEPQQRLRQAFE